MGQMPTKMIRPTDVLETPHETFVIVYSYSFLGVMSHDGWCVSTATGRRYRFNEVYNTYPVMRVGDFSATRRAYVPTDKPMLLEFFEKLKKSQAMDTEEGRELYVELEAMARKLTKDDVDGVREDMQRVFSQNHVRCFNP